MYSKLQELLFLGSLHKNDLKTGIQLHRFVTSSSNCLFLSNVVGITDHSFKSVQYQFNSI